MSSFPLPRRPNPHGCPPPHHSLAERLQEAERRRDAVEQELARLIRESEADDHNAALAIAKLSADLNKERGRANEFERIMSAMRREFAVLNATAIDLAQRAGVSPDALEELKSMWTRASADPDYAAVGLHQSAEDFLIKAARTAFRKAHHPDTKPPPEKAAAEAEFKQNEAVFDKLFRARCLSR